LWVATFQDVTKYMRERMHGIVHSYTEGEAISVVLRDELTDESYDLLLTLKTSVPPEWEAVEVRQERRTVRVNATRDHENSYVFYQAVANAEVVNLFPIQ